MTTFDVVDIVYARLKNGVLAAAINGGVYKEQRPVNSQKEDVVVNSLPINNLDMQTGVVNVNIHVPNLNVVVNGTTDPEQPNWARLKPLAALGVIDLTDVWAEDYNFNIQQQVFIKDDEYKDHYINIRLDFFSINISN